jgi:hypothetical protein
VRQGWRRDDDWRGKRKTGPRKGRDSYAEDEGEAKEEREGVIWDGVGRGREEERRKSMRRT